MPLGKWCAGSSLWPARPFLAFLCLALALEADRYELCHLGSHIASPPLTTTHRFSQWWYQQKIRWRTESEGDSCNLPVPSLLGQVAAPTRWPSFEATALTQYPVILLALPSVLLGLDVGIASLWCQALDTAPLVPKLDQPLCKQGLHQTVLSQSL